VELLALMEEQLHVTIELAGVLKRRMGGRHGQQFSPTAVRAASRYPAALSPGAHATPVGAAQPPNYAEGAWDWGHTGAVL
jgi:hypothetical protein